MTWSESKAESYVRLVDFALRRRAVATRHRRWMLNVAIRAYRAARPPIWRVRLRYEWWRVGRRLGLLGPTMPAADAPVVHTEGPYR